MRTVLPLVLGLSLGLAFPLAAPLAAQAPASSAATSSNAFGCIFARGDGFSGISPMNPFVSEVIHKTSLEVDEKGTKAAAATAIRMRKGRASGDVAFDLTFDRPFFCAIQHRRTGAILFMGVIDDPGVDATDKVQKSKRGSLLVVR